MFFALIVWAEVSEASIAMPTGRGFFQATGLRGTNALSMYPQRFNYDRVGNRTHSTVGKEQRSYNYNNNNQFLSQARPKSTLIRGEPSAMAVRSNADTNWIAAIKNLNEDSSTSFPFGLL